MSKDTGSHTPPLQDAVLAWATAVNAVEVEAYRIICGGPVDRPHVATLLASVEAARLECERQAAGVHSAVSKDES